MQPKEFEKRYEKIWNDLWKLLEDSGCHTCFECSKKLKKKETSLWLTDTGMLGYCNYCTWVIIKKRDMWRKILG